MNWLAWRQNRTQFMIFGIIALAFAALVIPTGLGFWHTYQQALSACGTTNTCNQLGSELFQGDGAIVNAITMMGLAVPMLLGLFLGVPLIAKEYEDGTNKLVWTQSISRRKWLTAKLAWALLFALLYGLVITALITWWSRTTNALYDNRFNQAHFATQGLMPVAYSLFAVSLGIALGAWFKRVLLALAVTLGILIFSQATFAVYARQHFMAPAVVSTALDMSKLSGPPSAPRGAWELTQDIADGKGHVIHEFTADAPAECKLNPNTIQNGKRVAGVMREDGPFVSFDCLTRLGYRNVITYQPAYRYWDFQRIEAAIYIGMSVLPLAATYWLVLKRDA